MNTVLLFLVKNIIINMLNNVKYESFWFLLTQNTLINYYFHIT